MGQMDVVPGRQRGVSGSGQCSWGHMASAGQGTRSWGRLRTEQEKREARRAICTGDRKAADGTSAAACAFCGSVRVARRQWDGYTHAHGWILSRVQKKLKRRECSHIVMLNFLCSNTGLRQGKLFSIGLFLRTILHLHTRTLLISPEIKVSKGSKQHINWII